MNELSLRGVKDILIAVVDWLQGFPETITTTFVQTTVQTCVVHLIRNSLAYVSWRDRKAVAEASRQIYQTPTAEIAATKLEEFERRQWGKKYPTIAPKWKRVWENLIAFYIFPEQIRKIIYTTNAIENLHRQLRKVIKNRGHFPSDQAASKLLYLALKNITQKWEMPPITWNSALN